MRTIKYDKLLERHILKDILKAIRLLRIYIHA